MIFFEKSWQNYDAIIFSQYYSSLLAKKNLGVQYLQSLEKTIDIISAFKQIIIVSDVPDLGISLPRLARMNKIGFDIDMILNPELLESNKQSNQCVQSLADRKHNVKYLDITPYIYQLLERGEIIYRDKDHLNPYGSELLGDMLLQENNILL